MPVAALLLTGGASRRMGRDKGTIPWPGTAGTTLASRAGQLIRAVADPALEVGAGVSGLPAVPDDPTGEGPLSAVATGARELRRLGWTGDVLVVATDLPRLTSGLLSWLAQQPAGTSVVPTDGGRDQPLCARYRAADISIAERLAAEGERSLSALLAAVTPRRAGPEEWSGPAGDSLALRDADTESELERLLDVSWGTPAPGAGPAPSVTSLRVLRYSQGRRVEIPESVATEEPLEIRAAGPGQDPAPVAVTMRTPGNDFELAAGFLVTEGLAVAPDIAAIGYCDGVAPDRRWNTVTVFLRQPWDLGRARQGVVSASCGVCGKDSIEQVELACPPVAPVGQIKGSVVSALPELLRATQTAFDRTGGLHAAGLFTPSGGAVCSREDVGRHNAVDKVVGHLLLSRKAPPAGSALAVSGRVSFEIVQKAAVARLGLVVAVSAPSSLAVAAARRLGVTVVGFVRGGRFNVYSHPERLDLDG